MGHHMDFPMIDDTKTMHAEIVEGWARPFSSHTS